MNDEEMKQLLNETVELATTVENVPLHQNLLKLYPIFYELLTENDQMRNSIREYRRNEQMTQELKKVGHFLYRPNEEIAYCNRCWEEDQRLEHCHLETVLDTMMMRCPKCESTFNCFN